MSQKQSSKQKPVTLFRLLLPFVLAGLTFWSVKNVLTGSSKLVALSVLTLIAIVTIVPLMAWLSNAISNSKLGKPSQEVNLPILASKKSSFSIKLTRHPLRFHLLLYVIGLIFFILIVVLSIYSGAISP